MKRGISAFTSDIVHIYTAPVRMSPSNLLVLGGTVGAGAALYANDDAIYRGFLRSRGQSVYDAVLDVGDAFEPLGFMGRTNFIWSVALVSGYALGNSTLRTIPAELLESHIIAGGFRQAGKLIVRRRRPNAKQGARSFGEGTSFPSGHASVIAELATIVSHHYRHPAVAVVSYGIATTVCLQRIDSGNHWPSDVLAGAAYGTYVAHTVFKRNEERRNRDQTSGGLEVLPAERGKGWSAMPWYEPGLIGVRVHVTL